MWPDDGHLFVCVEVLRPSQPNGVMSSAVSLPNHTFTGQTGQGENDRRKYLMINLHERILPTSAGVEPVTSWSPVRRRIQLSHRGRPMMDIKINLNQYQLYFMVQWFCLITGRLFAGEISYLEHYHVMQWSTSNISRSVFHVTDLH